MKNPLLHNGVKKVTFCFDTRLVEGIPGYLNTLWGRLEDNPNGDYRVELIHALPLKELPKDLQRRYLEKMFHAMMDKLVEVWTDQKLEKD